MLEFEEDLKTTLTELEKISKLLDKNNIRKSEIREAIDKFMKMHNLKEFEIISTIGTLWRLQYPDTTPKREVTDWNKLLKLLTPQQLEQVSERIITNWNILLALLNEEQKLELIKETPKESILNTRPVKRSKPAKGKGIPEAPVTLS